jgi:hypothetical protein
VEHSFHTTFIYQYVLRVAGIKKIYHKIVGPFFIPQCHVLYIFQNKSRICYFGNKTTQLFFKLHNLSWLWTVDICPISTSQQPLGSHSHAVMMYNVHVQASRFRTNNESLVLLKLAGIVLSLINTKPSYVKGVILLCIFAGNWAGKQVHSTSSPNIAITLSSPTFSLL